MHTEQKKFILWRQSTAHKTKPFFSFFLASSCGSTIAHVKVTSFIPVPDIRAEDPKPPRLDLGNVVCLIAPGGEELWAVICILGLMQPRYMYIWNIMPRPGYHSPAGLREISHN